MVDESDGNWARRREEVVRLLSEGANEKRMLGAGHTALEVLQRAYDLATEPEKIAAPWPQLAAYRLAHVRMRRAQSAEDFEEVEALFAEAARARILGPWPRLYHLSVLSRMSRLKGPRRVPPKRLEEAFQLALTEVRDTSTRRGAGARDSEGDDGESETPRAQLQDPVFNALELSAYFLGIDYAPLEGLGDELAWISGVESGEARSGWRLLGNDPSLGRVTCRQDVALAELEDAATAFPNAVLFKFGRKPVWSGPRRGPPLLWLPCRKTNTLELLSVMLDVRTCTDERARAALGYQPDTKGQASFRKMLDRAREDLAEFVGRDADSVILVDAEGALRLGPGIEVFGVLDIEYAAELVRGRSRGSHD